VIKHLFTAAAIIALFCGCTAQDSMRQTSANQTPGADTGQAIKITSWNLQWFPGKRPADVPLEEQELHITAVASVLNRLDPDIVCVQEIKNPKALDKLITEALPNHSVQIVSNFRGTQEVAILSRHTADTAFMEEFVKAEATPPRGFAYAAFRFGDQMVAVYTVHLKSNWGGVDETAPKREESARQLVTHAAEMTALYEKQGTPLTIILSGDFNYDPGREDWNDDQTFRILREAGFVWTGQKLPRDETITWISNGRYPDAAFDHILVKPAGGVTAGHAETEKTDRTTSDHRPISITVELP
jgi:endonuclease/exonuclease/phosphatase family metal-dependent hydrolase